MNNQKGFSLTEIITTLAVAAIIMGVGSVQYGKYVKKTDISNLCDKATLFAVGVRNCIVSSGGWEVKRFSQGTETCKPGESEPCIKMTPCKATDTAGLKKKLNFICPVKDDPKTGEGCSAVATPDYYCLNMKKDKVQVIVHLDVDSKDYKVYSGEPATFETVTPATCVKSPSYGISKDEFCGTATGTTTGTTPGQTSGTTQGQTSGTTAGQTTTGKTSGADPLGGNQPGTTDGDPLGGNQPGTTD